MDPLNLISKDKVHHFFAFLPLLTFIFLKVNMWILVGYTLFFALFEVYSVLLLSFSKLVTKGFLNLKIKDK
ncbi:MAG: hypothetical protein ABIA56_05150, partial [Actinomycetota bacterium]